MPTLKGNLSVAIEEYVWKWPEPTVSELRRFMERDVDTYLTNALQDVSMVLGMDNSWVMISLWVKWAEEWITIPEEIREGLFSINEARCMANSKFPSLNKQLLDAARIDIMNVMTWLRAEFPAAGVECLPDDFGR